MTEEEKTEFIDEMTEKIYWWAASEKPKIKQAIKEGLEKGLEEGRISTIEKYSQVNRATIFSVETLEDEKCELIGIIQGKDKVIAELTKENAELKEYYHKKLKDEENAINRIVELTKENAEQKAQIEKLKSDYEQLLDEKIEVENRLAESRECY